VTRAPQTWRRAEHPGGERELLRYAAEPETLLPGHSVRVLEDGRETFPVMLEAIAVARSFVHLETYIFEDDETGRAFAAALRERARARVAVRLVVDGFGSLALPEPFIAGLEHDGVQVVTYHRLLDDAPGRAWLRRNHRKVLVVDGDLAFTGGLNIGDDYAPTEQGGRGWRDTHARIRGPLVAELEALFRDTWIDGGGEVYPTYPLDSSEVVIGPDAELAGVVASGWTRRSVIRRHVLHAVQRAA
jgi:cardiolipin synthase